MATVRARILPSGRKVWQVDYRDAGGKRRSKQFDLKREADGYLMAVQHELRQGVHVADSASITIAQAAALWQKRAADDGLERSTLEQYRQHVEYHIVPRIGAVKLSRFTAPQAQAFADELARCLSRALAKKVITSVSSIFANAQARGLVGANPIKAVKLRSSSRDRKEIELPSKAELRAILAATPDRHKPLIYTALFTGMRSSELRGLSWDDVDLEAKVVRVRQRADRYNRIGPPKSAAGFREIPLPPTVVGLLREWQKVCPTGPHKLVFPTGAGNIENHGNLLRRIFWPIQVAAGVVIDTQKKDDAGDAILDAKYSLHALRHAAASLFIEQGWSAKRVQVLMGHASISVTFDTYGKLFEARDNDAAAMAALENSLLGV